MEVDFLPVVADDHVSAAGPLDQRCRFWRHATVRDRSVRDHSQALTGDVINDIENPEPPPTGKLVTH